MLRPLALVVFLLGCSVGEVPVGGDNPGVDSGTPGGDGGNALCATRVTPPAIAHIHGAGIGGGTQAGQGCIAVGCHLTGQTGVGAPAYIAAGTAYKPDNNTPAAGIEVRVTADGGGNPLIAKTDDAGNFFISSATNPFPGKTLASGCPTTDAKMVTPLSTATDGNCNSGACHLNPGGASGPINLADQ